MGKQELLQALVELVAKENEETSRYYDQDSSPLPKRTYLRLVKQGKVKGFKEGHTVLVLRDDLHTYLENERRVVPKEPKPDATPADVGEGMLQLVKGC